MVVSPSHFLLGVRPALALCVWLAVVLAAPAQAGVFSFEWTAGTSLSAPHPAGGAGSLQFQPSSTSGAVAASLRAQSYTDDPSASAEWGLLERDMGAGRPQGWIIQGGLGPAAAGSVHWAAPGFPSRDASFIEISLQAAGEVMFTSAEVVMQDIEFLGFDDGMWAGLFADGQLTGWGQGTVVDLDSGPAITWSIPSAAGLSQPDGSGVSLRLYGVLGSDQGWFGQLTAVGTFGGVSPLAPLPEPGAAVVSALAAGLGAMRRRRRMAGRDVRSV